MILPTTTTTLSPLSIGNMQIQPVVDSSSTTRTTLQNQSANSLGQLQPQEQNLNTTIVLIRDTISQTIKDPTLNEIIEFITSEQNYILPISDTENVLNATYNVDQTSQLQNTTNSQQQINVNTTLETSANVSPTCPLLITSLNFYPIFDKDSIIRSKIDYISNNQLYSYFTDTGKYFDAQLQLRNLWNADQIQIVNELYNSYSNIKSTIKTQKDTFKASLQDCQQVTIRILQLAQMMSNVKGRFSLRDSNYLVNPYEIAQTFVLNYTLNKSLTSTTSLISYIDNYMNTTYNVDDVLTKIGFDQNNLQLFSSTKLFLQLLYEFKMMLRFQSFNMINADQTSQRSDAAQFTILNYSDGAFFYIPASTSTNNTIDSVALTTTTQNFSKVYSSIISLFKELYTNNIQTDETKIAAIANLVSKEYRYSYALSQDNTKSILQQYSYNVKPIGNLAIFESIFGNIKNVLDFTTTGISAISHQSSILTFETQQLSDGISTYTPATTYVDDLIDTAFDATKINELADAVELTNKQFSLLIDALNVTCASNVSSVDSFTTHNGDTTNDITVNTMSTDYSNLLNNPTLFVQDVLSKIIDIATGETLQSIKTDPIAAIYSLSYNNVSLKAALFLYTIFKTQTNAIILPEVQSTNATAFSATVDMIINLLTGDVVNILSDSQVKVLPSVQQISVDQIKVLFSGASTPVITFVNNVFTNTLNALRKNSFAIDLTTSSLRYSALKDIVVMMAVFDMTITLLAKYSNSSLSGYFYTKKLVQQQTSASDPTILTAMPVSINSTLTYAVSTSSFNNLSSKNEIVNQTNKEIALTQQIFYTIFNILSKYYDSLRNFSGYVTSLTIKTNLDKISTSVKNQQLVKLMFSEQQLLTCSNVISDLLDKSSIASTDAIINLGNAFVDDNLRDILYALLSTDEFGEKRGNNKKIFTIGIPNGFIENLKKDANIAQTKNTTYENKESDIVQVSVYKVDIENSDIVFKPQKFLFELSKFSTTNSKLFKRLGAATSINDIISCVPMRDFSIKFGNTQYWYENSLNVQDAAFTEQTYDFLSSEQKYEIAKNHAISVLMTIYVKLLTGLSVSEFDFSIIDVGKYMESSVLKTLINGFIKKVSTIAQGQTFSQINQNGTLFTTTSGNTNNVPGNVNTNIQFAAIPQQTNTTTLAQQTTTVNGIDLTKLSQNIVSSVMHGLKIFSNISHEITDVSNIDVIKQLLFSPRIFDRIFNIVIDPDYFEIDVNTTNSTVQGSDALKQLISFGDVTSNDGNLSYRTRDKNQGDYSLEKYFITLETFTG